MDIASYNLSRKSHEVLFLPTQLPENRKGVLKKASELRAQDQGSTDITMPDLWRKYLDRPSGSLFDDLTYKQFYQKFHQVFSGPVRFIRQPPYNDVQADGRNIPGLP